MLFTSLQFGLFFALVFASYWAIPWHRPRMIWLLLCSASFYYLAAGWGLAILAGSCLAGYLLGRLIEATSGKLQRLWLVVGIVLNLGLLGLFKYFNFFIENLTALLTTIGWQRDAWVLQLALPLGISFFTFEAISYLVDVYRQKIKAVRDPLEYALFILFFPHLVAGPIVRAKEFLPQVRQVKRFNWSRMLIGTKLVLLGLLKKGVLADHLASVVEPVFAHPANFSTGSIWVGMMAYSLQIYFDFSGYADLAIGFAHMLGFKLPANFKNPLMASSPADFWQRWHCSLGRWLYDYLYVPLGGNKRGPWIACRNLMIVFLLGGLWHGANWTFIIWGLYHGILVAGQRVVAWPKWLGQRAWLPVSIMVTFLLMAIGRVFFRCQTLSDAINMLAGLFRPITAVQVKSGYVLLTLISLGLAMFCAALWEYRGLRQWLLQKRGVPLGIGLAGFWILLLLFWPERSQSFIYFQF